MKKTTASLLVAALFITVPALGQADAPAPLGNEAQTDIETVNGVPVNPELKARILELQQQGKELSVQELMELSHKVLNQQQEQLAEQSKDDTSWMGQDPLGHLEGEMSDLVGDLDQSKTGEDTQAQGQDVVRKLDTLIAMMEKSCSACSSCAGNGQKPGDKANGNKPAEDSTLAQGPGGSGDLNDKGVGNNQFGDLDPAQRDAILRAQENQKGFPAEYDALLAEYYARLASEQALDEPEADAGDE